MSYSETFWKKIINEYESGGISYNKLADKYSVSSRQVKRKVKEHRNRKKRVPECTPVQPKDVVPANSGQSCREMDHEELLKKLNKDTILLWLVEEVAFRREARRTALESGSKKAAAMAASLTTACIRAISEIAVLKGWRISLSGRIEIKEKDEGESPEVKLLNSLFNELKVMKEEKDESPNQSD